MREGLLRVFSDSRFSRLAAGVISTAFLVWPVTVAESATPIPDFSGQWGRDMLFFEPPSTGPGPIVNAVRKADGTRDPHAPCCAIVVAGGWVGDYTNPILKRAAAESFKNYRDLSDKGIPMPDLH